MPPALAVTLLAAAAPLFARGSETLWGLAPCELCLWQRWPYWVAAGLGLLACFWPNPRVRRALLALAGVAVLVSGGIAVLHVGVEQGWWPSPLPGCQAPRAAGTSVQDMLSAMPLRPNKPCDAPTFLIPFLPLSMAAMNLIYALALGGFALKRALRKG
jgi:disulfide bond formation protein DsbB